LEKSLKSKYNTDRPGGPGRDTDRNEQGHRKLWLKARGRRELGHLNSRATGPIPAQPNPSPSSSTAMAAATEKTAEDIRRELQELQRQHREVPLSPLSSTSLEASASPRCFRPDLFPCSSPPRRSPSDCATPAAFAVAPPASVPEGPARSAASRDLYASRLHLLPFAFSIRARNACPLCFLM
jgi:hypothetical protein